MVTKLVGARMKELRTATGLSQEAFANSIDMARTYYAEVETGKRNVSVRNLVKITDGLGVTPFEFFNAEVFNPLYDELSPEARKAQGLVDYAAIDLPADDEGEGGGGK